MLSEKFADWEKLFLFYLKRDWKRILLWLILLTAFAGGFVSAFDIITEDQGLPAMYEIMQNPAMIAIIGDTPVEAASEYTLGAMYAHMMLLFTVVMSAIVSMLHVISHTRKEEDEGMTEYISAFKIGRQANSLAVIVETIFVNMLLGGLISALMLSFDYNSLTVEGTLLYASSIAMSGIMGGAVALVMVQIFPSSSGATGASLGIIGLLFLARAMTDIINSDLTFLNPLGWTYLTNPFTENNWHLLLYAVTFSLLAFVLAFVLESRRDMGTGYLPENKGKERASRSLLSIPGLVMRLNRGIIISWLIGFILLGIAYGSIYADLQTFVESNDLIASMFAADGVTIEESYTGIIMRVMVNLVAILPVVLINKLFTEEKKLRLNQIFSTKVSRGKIYWTTVIIALVSGILGMLLTTGSLGLFGRAVMEESSHLLEWADFFIIGFNEWPTVFFITGLAAVLIGWLPQLNIFPYIFLTYNFFINYIGQLIDFPEWMKVITVQYWVPILPIEDFNTTSFVVISVLSIFLMKVGYIGYNGRDLIEEG